MSCRSFVLPTKRSVEADETASGGFCYESTPERDLEHEIRRRSAGNFLGRDRGCTPGYSKNHADNRAETAFAPTFPVLRSRSTTATAGEYRPLIRAGFGGMLLMGIERFDPFDGALGMSLATRVGSLLYTSGMVGFDGATGTVPDDLEDEIRRVFANLGNILTDAGSSIEHVLEQTNFLVGDPAVVYPVFQKVRTEVFAGHLPASTSVFVQSLVAPQCHCEVKLVAAVPD